MKRYRVTLTAAERDELAAVLSPGKADVRRLKHAQWEDGRNATQAKVTWHLTTNRARAKLRSLYPSVEG